MGLPGADDPIQGSTTPEHNEAPKGDQSNQAAEKPPGNDAWRRSFPMAVSTRFAPGARAPSRSGTGAIGGFSVPSTWCGSSHVPLPPGVRCARTRRVAAVPPGTWCGASFGVQGPTPWPWREIPEPQRHPIRRLSDPHSMPKTPVLLVALVLLTLPRWAAAQEVIEQIQALAIENAQGYAAPLTEGLSYVLASGYTDRSAPMSAFGFDVGFRVLGSRPGREHRSFQAVLPDSVVFSHPTLGDRTYHGPYRARDGSLETPTIAGKGPGVTLVPDGAFEEELLAAGEDPDDYSVAFPEGISLPVTPLVVIHASLGVGLGTEVSFRYLPASEVAPELGQVSSQGLTVSHLISRWFELPLDLTATVGYQDARGGDVVRASGTHYGLVGGFGAGPMNFFGGALIRSASAELRYRVENPGGVPGIPDDGMDVSVRSSTSSSPGYTLGARLQLLALNLAGHYTFGAHDVLSIKLGLGLPDGALPDGALP
jgi:hypothetical protein